MKKLQSIMIKFFRNIRKRLLNHGKTSQYLKYAIGEIILVVIGILIALQINNWNQIKQNHKKEKLYLTEIVTNLKQDSIRLKEVLEYNEFKEGLVQNILKIFPDSLTNEERTTIILKNLEGFPKFEFFSPKQTAFKNLMSAESINLISNKAIRNLLIDYYEREYEKTQERVWIINRRIIDEHFHKFISREMIEYSTAFPTRESLTFYKDTKLYNDLFGLLEVVKHQTRLIEDIETKNQELVSEIKILLD